MTTRTHFLSALLLAPLSLLYAADDIPIADFEGADYGVWTVSGKAFGTGPAQGALPGQQPVSGYQGRGLVNTFLGGDDSHGELLSPEFAIERDYINFLIGAGKRSGEAYMALMVDGKVVCGATGSDKEALDPANWDVKNLRGKKARIRIVDHAQGGWGHINVDQIAQSNEPQGKSQTDAKVGQEWVVSTAELYNETFRPQFHLTAQKNWLNDPNGLVFYKGEYHLFFQHNPTGINWGNMTWGHAVSPDLMHWQQLLNAIEPDAMGTIFSGSAVVDWNNTAGFQKGDEKTLVAIYTADSKHTCQCIAYSNDRGRTWTKYSGNPVLPSITSGNRDPKVIWHALTKRWIMALFLDKTDYALFASPDLKQWTQLQTLENTGGAECPDFFPMTVSGKPGVTKWVFTSANGFYTVGDFDGKTFKPDGKPRPINMGGNYYAVQSYSDIPKEDGRRIQIAWMSGSVFPRMPFNQQMSLPCVLTLHAVDDCMLMCRYPVREIEGLRAKSLLKLKEQPLAVGKNALAAVKGDLFDIDAEFALGDAKEIVFTLRGQTVQYKVPERRLRVMNNEAELAPVGDRLKLRILADRTALDVFGNDGRVSFTSFFVADPNLKDLSLTAVGGTARIAKLDVYELKSAWH
ncbi:MAG: glycoside hydrolase family 32 protein [bacterium]